MNVTGIGLAVLIVWLGSATRSSSQSTQAERQQFAATKAEADKGDALAQFTLGNYYAFGTGVSRDLVKAAKWHRKAAEQGLAQAQLRLAYEYVNGIGLKTDPIEAVKWLRRAAEHGSTEAQFELGRSYAEGQGVGENPVQAATWYRKAAEQNYPPAEYALGTCYFEGYGVTKDVPEGVDWTRKAAEQGYAPAENSYGLCFAKGKGVPQNYLEAYKWFNLSAAQGGEHNNEARINLSMAERAMTPEQIAEGQKLARDFKPQSGSPVQTAEPGHRTGMSGVVTVKADDETAEVYADGNFVGNAPSKLKLEPGMHVIEVKKAGFKPYRRDIKVTEGAELNLRATLEHQ
ncbi:MAG TPA: PEGA domain-containing protein [Verrucomicrobiae bacterium]|nr:PEGA domain-containing protein [Verrucomicrobiae bacterium]